MTWTKLGDEFADECWTLSVNAFRLHAEGLLWSNRMLLDGQLAKDDMRRWGRHPEAAEELVDRGYWEDRGEYYQIIHHIGYQPTAESVRRTSLARQKAANTRWKRGSNRKQANEPLSNVHSTLQSNLECTGVGSGRDGEGLETEPNYVSADAGKNNGFHSAPDNELDGWFALGADYEPPTTDADGFPIDEGTDDESR
jgi:hypothetical protein